MQLDRRRYSLVQMLQALLQQLPPPARHIWHKPDLALCHISWPCQAHHRWHHHQGCLRHRWHLRVCRLVLCRLALFRVLLQRLVQQPN